MNNPTPKSPQTIYHNPLASSYRTAPAVDQSAEIQAFYNSLPNYTQTPLVPLPDLASKLGIKSLYIKAETSRLGLPSFKLLGASWAIRQAIIQRTALSSSAILEDLETAIKEYGIRFCAATDGNHGRSVAFMGHLLGVESTKVFVPRDLDEEIIGTIKDEGADVVVVEGNYDETVRTAHRYADDNPKYMLIEAVAYEGYEDVPRWAVQGYQTLFQEIDAQLLSLDPSQTPTHVLVPCGVGSLAQACITHYKSPSSSQLTPLICTTEPTAASTLHTSLLTGSSVTITTHPTIMAGLRCETLSTLAWPTLKGGVDVSVTITDFECQEAIDYLERYGIGAGPCGAATLAGLWKVAGDEEVGMKGMFDEESVVVCVCTEGRRGYERVRRGDGGVGEREGGSRSLLE